MMIGSLVSRDFYMCFCQAVYFQYPPLNNVSCLFISPNTTSSIGAFRLFKNFVR